MPGSFQGLPKDFFIFFKELSQNNDKAWFEANKDRYKAAVVGPLQDLILAMQPRLAKISKHIKADPRPVGGSLFRIYRDTRFSKDKRPYKENAGVHFRHERGKDAHVPGYYVHLAPGEVFYGGGIWMPDPEALGKLRGAIADKPSAWKKVIEDKSLAAAFEGIEGESLARPPKGFEADHPYIEDIKRKSFFAMKKGSETLTRSAGFLDELEETFRAASPLMRFLCNALDAPF
ncbi:MAG: DUF2461 domain-containing protein [Alphaproteobacteria bacterium]|nr:DUF2461 domain-containing protein [Alphaproteobacteria bacterium]